MTDRQRNGFILLLVVGLVAASLAVVFTKKTVLGLDLKGGVQLIYQGEPSAQVPKVTPAALNQAVNIMRQRVDQLGSAHRTRSAPQPSSTSTTGRRTRSSPAGTMPASPCPASSSPRIRRRC
jgi:preprotein translocase subunit SecD